MQKRGGADQRDDAANGWFSKMGKTAMRSIVLTDKNGTDDLMIAQVGNDVVLTVTEYTEDDEELGQASVRLDSVTTSILCEHLNTLDVKRRWWHSRETVNDLAAWLHIYSRFKGLADVLYFFSHPYLYERQHSLWRAAKSNATCEYSERFGAALVSGRTLEEVMSEIKGEIDG